VGHRGRGAPSAEARAGCVYTHLHADRARKERGQSRVEVIETASRRRRSSRRLMQATADRPAIPSPRWRWGALV